MINVETIEIPIYLNIYENEEFLPLGLGFYYSGVQLEGKEWTFLPESGIFNHPLRHVPYTYKLRDSIFMGMYTGTRSQIDSSIDELKQEFKGNNYNAISKKNCNCFANAFLLKPINREIPGWVNRYVIENIVKMCYCTVDTFGYTLYQDLSVVMLKQNPESV